MKKIYGFLIAGALTLSATGCSDSLLDIDNPNQTTVDNFWTTSAEAEAAINACYSAFYKDATLSLIHISEPTRPY